MKEVKSLIWSGCSYSAGSGFLHEEYQDGPVSWRHPEFEKQFKKVNTQEEAWVEIKKNTFPILLGEKLGVELNVNLAHGGTGHQTAIKRIMSYVLNNKSELDLKNTIIGLQITHFSRVELIDATPFLTYRKGDVWNYHKQFVQVDSDYNGYVSDFFIRHYDKDWFDAKAITEILMFKGWVESLGATPLIFDVWKIFPKRWEKPEDEVLKQILSAGLGNDEVLFPKLNILKDELNLVIPPKLGLRENPFETFHDEGYFDDAHFSKKGHKQISEFLYEYVINNILK